MIGFAFGHLIAFNWASYNSEKIPEGSRMRFYYAVRDCFGPGDLIWDFKVTFLGNLYSYRNFNSAEAVVAHRNARSRLGRLQAGLRYTDGGRGNYWVDEVEPSSTLTSGYGSTQEDEPWTDLSQNGFIPEDPNYPVKWDVGAYKYSREIGRLRQNVRRAYDREIV